MFQALPSLQQISDGSLDDVEIPNISDSVEPVENDNFDLPSDFMENDVVDKKESPKKKKVKKNRPKCELCDKIFRDNYKLNRHIRIHIKAGELPPESLIPLKKRVRPIEEIEKILSENNIAKPKRIKKIHDCKECNKVFRTAQKLRRHEQVHVKAKQLITLPNVPSQENTKPGKGSKILAENLGEGYNDYLKDFFKYECAILKENGNVVLRYSCLLCLPVKNTYMAYKNPIRHLGSHIRSMHPHLLARYDEATQSLITNEPNFPTKPPFCCPDCQEEFETYLLLKDHWQDVHKVKIDRSQKSFLCTLCGKTFQQNHKYTFHMWREHGVGKPQEHECEVCGKKVPGPYRSQALAQHMLIHKGTKDHVCHICGAGFLRQTSLRYHTQKVHENTGKYECMYCDYKTPTRNHLEVHVNAVHTKAIKYSCEDCNFSCYVKGNLTAHKKTVHLKLKPHKCQICPEAYIRKSELEKHISATGHVSNIGN